MLYKLNVTIIFLFCATSTPPALTFDKEAAHQGITGVLCPVAMLWQMGYGWISLYYVFYDYNNHFYHKSKFKHFLSS